MFPVLFPATSGNPPFSPKKVPGDLSESIPQQLWTARPDGALDFVNGRVLEYFGRTFEEMIARGWHDLIHPEDVDEAAERWMHSVATGCFYEVEVRLRHARDETYGWHLAQASADRDAQGTITRWVGTNTDLSRRPIAREKNAERREAEVTIRTQESQLRQIGDNLPDGFLYQLLAELNGIRRFIYFSAGMERITGVSMEEALGDAASLYGLIDPEDLSWMAAEEERCLKEGLNYDVVIRSRHRKTGEWRWIHIRSAPRMLPDGRRVWDGIYLDVTKARQTEEALARSMERLELAQRVGRIGVYDWLVKTGEVIRNEEQRRIFGLGAEESGETIEAFQKRVHPDDMERIRKEMAAVIARRQTDTDFTYRIVRNDGAIRWAEGAARFFYDEAGALQRMVGVNIDITEKQEAQRTLERSEASLRSIVESASASGIGIVRSHLDGRILEANDAFLRMVGYTREELASGRVNWRAMTPQEFLEVDAREIRKIEATRQSHSFEKEYLRKDGSRVPILLSANFVPGAEGEFICFVLDLSGPKSAQSALRDARDAAEAASNAKDHFLATLSH
ncbi:MAG: PAS domain-containing protein, partial [Verrucomicrobiota bacterium]